MTRDEILSVYNRHIAFEQNHDHVGAASTYAPDGYYMHTPLGLLFKGRDQVAAQYASSYESFPDAHFEIEHEIVEGNTLYHSGVMQATMTGPYLGIKPTGRKVALPFSARIEFANGQMRGETLWYDILTLCAQAGLDVKEVAAVADSIRQARPASTAA